MDAAAAAVLSELDFKNKQNKHWRLVLVDKFLSVVFSCFTSDANTNTQKVGPHEFFE